MIDDTNPLMDEIYRVMNNDDTRLAYSWEIYFRIRQPCPVELEEPTEEDLKLVSPEESENIYRPLKMLNFDTSRDYELAVGDESSVIAVFPIGLWYKILEPCRDYLEAVVTRKPRTRADMFDADYGEEQMQVYYAIPKISEGSVGEGSKYTRFSRSALDMTGVVDIEFQLMDLSLEQLRNVYTGDIFRQTTAFDALRATIAKATEEVMVEDTGPAVESYKFFEADNTEEREHVVIPQSTQLFDVPQYLQTKCGGIYSTGIAIYLQNKSIYVYPPYNTKRYEKESKTLTILKLPDSQYEDVEKTFMKDGDNLIVLALTDSNFSHTGSNVLRNDGSGIRFADARQFMDGLVETKDNKAIAHRAKVNHEYLYKDIKVKEESNNRVQRSPNRIHANPFQEDSLLALKDGNYIAFKWNNSDASLLYPAMPVKVLYMLRDELKEIRGTLLKVMHSTQMSNKGVTSSSYTEQTALYVYVQATGEDDEA